MNIDIDMTRLRIAVLLPCYNEAAAIGITVEGFRAVFPNAEIYVYDNNSSDGTTDVAAAAGATVRTERRQGKGAVVRRMFADVDADIYVMADGDATYDASAAPGMVALLIRDQLDMVVGARDSMADTAYRTGHKWGNKMLTGLLTLMFGMSFSDILTGYRVFSRRFVKSFPAHSTGFEIETEISVHALEMHMPIAEVRTTYFSRPEGSQSKLSTYRDGWRILTMMINLYRSERPLEFFGLIGAMLMIVAAVLAVPLVITYFNTGLVPRLPTAVLVVGITIVAILSILVGVILDTVTKGRAEIKRLVYLQILRQGGNI